MTSILLKDTAGSLTVYVERAADGSAATGLVASTIAIDLKKAGASSFVSKSLVNPAQAAAAIGAGVNGTVTTTVDTTGLGGNTYTVAVLVPAGTSGLSTNLAGTVLQVSLAVIGGVPDAAANTATLVAAAVSLEAGLTAVASGTGAASLTSTEGPTVFSGGLDGNFREFSGGFYEIDLTAAETSVAGSLDVRWSGATVRTSMTTLFIAVVTPTSPVATQPPPLSSLFGFIYDPAGAPVVGAAVSARVLSQPTVLYPATEGIVLSSGLVTALSDTDGFFTLALIAGTQVDVFIPSSNFRRTLTVPATATNIFDIS